MEIPAIGGTIRRRLLVNFRADPTVVQAKLPSPFRPKLQAGNAIVGVCLIRLEHVRPLGLTLPVGLSSENAAHRIAVTWDEKDGTTQEGVFIPRRDTDSLMTHLAGGRVFPTEHHLAAFQVEDDGAYIDFAMHSRDDAVNIRVVGQVGTALPPTSCFASLADASSFFEHGCLGFSARCDSDRLDGLRLETDIWHVEPLQVTEAYSSYFADERQFPMGSIAYDHTLLMRNIEHEWHPVADPTAVLS